MWMRSRVLETCARLTADRALHPTGGASCLLDQPYHGMVVPAGDVMHPIVWNRKITVGREPERCSLSIFIAF